MKQLFARSLAQLTIFLVLPMGAFSQTGQQAGTLTIAGQQDQASTVRINGKTYVDIESLARITHGSVRFQGSHTILTLPGSAATSSTQAVKTPQLSGNYLGAEIEALTQIREWRASLASAIQNNYPVTEDWVGGVRRSADAKLQLATAAATTEADQKAAELLKNEFTAMQQMSDQFVAMHSKASYIAPDSVDHNELDQKILSCQHALVSMASTKQFQDEPSCH